jgi:hypothetical protein
MVDGTIVGHAITAPAAARVELFRNSLRVIVFGFLDFLLLISLPPFVVPAFHPY